MELFWVLRQWSKLTWIQVFATAQFFGATNLWCQWYHVHFGLRNIYRRGLKLWTQHMQIQYKTVQHKKIWLLNSQRFSNQTTIPHVQNLAISRSIRDMFVTKLLPNDCDKPNLENAVYKITSLTGEGQKPGGFMNPWLNLKENSYYNFDNN